MNVLKLATEHLNRTNPSLWNGEGIPPQGFDGNISTYIIGETLLLDIHFEKIDSRWTICCELRKQDSTKPFKAAHCLTINSPRTLSDSLTWLLQGCIASNRAMEIAEEHLRQMNPSLWNGEGNPPEDFDSRIASYNVGELEVLDVSFENIDGKWMHYCELRDCESEDLLEDAHGDGVNSIQNLADTIAKICNWNH